jgi:hypothetical protein
LKWKKLYGYYLDTTAEVNAQYAVARNKIFNAEV